MRRGTRRETAAQGFSNALRAPTASPFHSVGHDRWNRWRAATHSRVLEVGVVFHVKTANLDAGATGVQVDTHVGRWRDARPEQTALGDPRVEVVHLRRRTPQTGVIDIDSGEHERRVAHVTVPALESSLHEAHVIGQVRQYLDSPVLRLIR